MDNKNMGITFTTTGFMFLMLSIVIESPSILWGFLLAVSIVLNLVGTGLIAKFLKESKTNTSQ
ncbi:hypothetical protein [Alkalibacillus almallahensis]|uniref:hypothetical protein n=1 Tax=Alkalibacillus almallahensis TaxID=1379154 RepID=UPI00142259FE|nr:hypothetical protein [Alkalibacillus almallahensis]NIK11647.1 hypothetical protein [Alkalibacillus almallahensis]